MPFEVWFYSYFYSRFLKVFLLVLVTVLLFHDNSDHCLIVVFMLDWFMFMFIFGIYPDFYTELSLRQKKFKRDL